MKKLTQVDFNRARDFLLAEARPLEKAQYALEFEGGGVEEVLAALEKFQNPDGGFGRALEPDVRTPSSSALCTEIGLRILYELHTPADHTMVQTAVKFLLDTFDPETMVWRVLPTDANEHPHAPWWHDEGGSLAKTFDDYQVIPRAGILAALHHYAGLVPGDWLAAVTQATVADIHSMDIAQFGGGGDSLVYTRRLAEAPGLSPQVKDRLTSRVIEIATQIVACDPDRWSEYCAPPLKLAPTPQAVTANALSDCIAAHLDYLLERLSPQGFWEPNWSWGDSYPADWAQARREWRGDLTLTNLLILRAFGRIEG